MLSQVNTVLSNSIPTDAEFESDITTDPSEVRKATTTDSIAPNLIYFLLPLSLLGGGASMGMVLVSCSGGAFGKVTSRTPFSMCAWTCSGLVVTSMLHQRQVRSLLCVIIP